MYNIVLATDDNYAIHACVAIESFLRTFSVPENVRVFLLGNNLSSEWIRAISKTVAEHNATAIVIHIHNIEDRLQSKLQINALSLATYSRLLLTELLPPDADTVLYLDCDMVVTTDLKPLLDTDLTTYELAAVADTMYPELKTQIGLNTTDAYFNAGLLLINLKKWREQNMVTQFINFIAKYNGNVPHLDQGVLNGTITKWLQLPLKYNVQAPIFAFNKYSSLLSYYSLSEFYSKEEYISAKTSPAVIHFTSFFLQRPWFHFCLHPFKDKYREIAKALFSDFSLSHNRRLRTLDKLKCLAFVKLQPLYLLIR